MSQDLELYISKDHQEDGFTLIARSEVRYQQVHWGQYSNDAVPLLTRLTATLHHHDAAHHAWHRQIWCVRVDISPCTCICVVHECQGWLYDCKMHAGPSTGDPVDHQP